LTLAALVLAAFSYGLQQTMVLPALAHLQRDLHTTTTWSTWIFTGFLLSSAVLTPLIGKLGDQHGKGPLLTISLAILLLGCIGAAAAWSIWSLIAFRVVQGAGVRSSRSASRSSRMSSRASVAALRSAPGTRHGSRS
jgi:MFS family permease